MIDYHKTKKYRDKLSKIRLEKMAKFGFLNSPETRQKMRLAKLGKPSGQKPMLNKKHSEKSKEKISQSMSGSKNPAWKGGLSSLGKQIRKSLKYRNWRLKVYKRDNWTCQNCKIRGIKLEPHHIKSLSNILLDNNIKTITDAFNCKELWDIKNGISLCKKCHSETDNFRSHR
jgi:hypothetical protein